MNAETELVVTGDGGAVLNATAIRIPVEGQKNVTIEYLGKSYTLPEETLEAAFRYMENLTLRKTAKEQLDLYIYGISRDAMSPDEMHEQRVFFEKTFFVSTRMLYRHADDIVERFKVMKKGDCNLSKPDCEIWYEAIEKVVEERGGVV